MDHRKSAKCSCDALDPVFVARVLEDIAELQGFLQPTDERERFRCMSCGQHWCEQREPFMHVDVPVVFKTWLDADGRADPVGYDLTDRRLRHR